MKLHAEYRELLVFYRHNLAFVAGPGPRDELVIFWQLPDNERMIAGGRKWRRNAPKDALPGMANRARLTVHDTPGMTDITFAAENVGQTLMPEAHAENRNRFRKFAQNIERYTGRPWSAGAGGKDNATWFHCFYFLNGDRIISYDRTFGTEQTDLLSQVPREGISVVDEEDAHGVESLEWSEEVQGEISRQ